MRVDGIIFNPVGFSKVVPEDDAWSFIFPVRSVYFFLPQPNVPYLNLRRALRSDIELARRPDQDD